MPTASGHTSAINAKNVLDKKIKDPTGKTIGDVEDIMLDKLSNNIMFAVASFGGFLGIGEKYHPVHWSLLTYDKDDGNYVVNLSKEQLQAAPAYSIDELTKEDGDKYRASVLEFYRDVHH